VVLSVSPTSDFVPASETSFPVPSYSETSFPAPVTTVSLDGTSAPSGFGTGTGTTSFFFPTNGTYTVPSATSVSTAGAMGLKIAGANVVGAAAAALVANFI